MLRAGFSWVVCIAASYSGSALKPGVSTFDDVRAAMGEPAAQWIEPDHSMQLSYPRGPSGFHSFMVYLDAAGRLQRIENVMDEASFNRISKGMTEADVVRVLGPPVAGWTRYFEVRDELVWEWRYCNDWSQAARFDVFFDGGQGIVRTSWGSPEICGYDLTCYCGH
jgi:hypothetical protein